MTACQSYRPGYTCADGFMQRAACHGHIGCMSCGHIDERYLPDCLKEEAPRHLFNDDGSPRFYRRTRP